MNKQQFMQHVYDTIEESEQQIEHGMTVDAHDALLARRVILTAYNE